MDAALRAELIAFCGIETEFNDAWGVPTVVSEHDQLALLSAQGFTVNDDDVARQQLEQRMLAFWQLPLQPVSVQQAAAKNVQLLLQLPMEEANDEWLITLTTEQSEQQSISLIPVDGELVQVMHIADTEYHQYQHVLPITLEPGYHQLELRCSTTGETFSQSLIITPEKCYQPRLFDEKKQWGMSLQLYSLRSEQNWGIGDFTDLAKTVNVLARFGADFIGLNPIHALYPALPDNASPYSPSSRRWLNIFYIDVEAMPGFAKCVQTKSLVQSPVFQQQLQLQREKDWVDYPGVMQLKLPVMKTLYQWFKTNTPELSEEFTRFKTAAGSSLQQLALYDALHSYLFQQNSSYWGWPNWPAEYQDPTSEKVNQFAAAHADELEFYSYLQFIAQQQLAVVQQQAKEAGMLLGLYRDLAVGVSEASTEIWGNRSLYCTDASIGAPPDPLGPAGQTWGLPPMYPFELYQQGYQPFVELLRSNMQAAGALRIDHVMALLRLWWVPKTANNAGGGAYVYYPIMDLLGILALESQRNQAVVIGEDLGTVPDGIRELLSDYGVYSYRVFFFETAADGGYISPAHYPRQAMATLTTHDLPTLTGYWHCEDLQLGRQLGLYPDELQLQQLYQQRHSSKQRILDSLHGHYMLPADYPRSAEHLAMDKTLNYAMQRHLAAGNNQLLSLQPEDLLQMTQPVNVPGTSSEYPNWRRKLSQPIEQWLQDADICHQLQQLTAIRQQS